MTAIQWVGLGIKVSLILIVFCVAMNTQRGDLLWLLRRPGLAFRSVLAMSVVMPVLAAVMAAVFTLNGHIELALIALFVAPVPPILPNKEVKAGASMSYSVGLLALSSVLAIVLVPVSVHLLGLAFGRDVTVPPVAILKAVGITLLAPLVAGAIFRSLAPGLAAKLVKPLTLIGNVLMIAAILPALVVAWPELMKLVGNFTLVAIVALVLAGLLVGHLLGGPDPGDRTALALSTAQRHPGVAATVAGIAMPHDKSVVMAVLLAFLVSLIATIPYTRWRRNTQSREVAGGP